MKCEQYDECNREEYWRGLCLAHLKASLRPQEENDDEVDEDLDLDSRTSDEEEE